MASALPAANLVLEDTVERIYCGDVFAETWKGLFLIRGENVVLLGEVVGATSYSRSQSSLTKPRTWTRRMMYLCDKLRGRNWCLTTSRRFQPRRNAKKPKPGFFSSRRDSVKKGAREMVTEESATSCPESVGLYLDGLDRLADSLHQEPSLHRVIL